MLELQEKIDLIRSLSEDQLREKVLVPLFSKMGFIDPIMHHHSNEKGKDIVLKELDHKFKKFNYIAAVVKAGDVNGSASGNSSYFTIINQVKQALNEPYKHIYEIEEINIDQVIIVISGKFLPTALESVYGTLKAERLDKAIREPIDVNKLVSLIDEFFIEFWDEAIDTKDSLRKQRDHLLNNFSKLAKILLPDAGQEKKLLSQISNTDLDINLFPFENTKKYVASVGYKSIDFDEIDTFFTDPNISNYYGDIRTYIFNLKKKTQRILYAMDEPIEIMKEMLSEKNPEKIVELTEQLESFVGRGNRLSFDIDDAVYHEDFDGALREYRAKKEKLTEDNLQSLFDSLCDAIIVEGKDYFLSIINEHQNSEKNLWVRLSVTIDKENMTHSKLSFEIFTKEIERKVNERGYEDRIIEYSEFSPTGKLVYERAIYNYGYGADDKELLAKRISEGFKLKIENLFFKYLGTDFG